MLQNAQALAGELTRLRREIHRHPEPVSYTHLRAAPGLASMSEVPLVHFW